MYPDEVTAKLKFINQLEAFNLVHAILTLLPPDPVNFNIIVNMDSLVMQQVLSSGTGRDPFLCACARKLWLISALESTSLTIVHKEGKLLVLADALSRFHKDSECREKATLACKEKKGT